MLYHNSREKFRAIEFSNEDIQSLLKQCSNSCQVANKRPKPKDKVQVIKGDYKGREGVVLESNYVCLKEDVILVKVDRLNKLYVSPYDVKVIQEYIEPKKYKKYHIQNVLEDSVEGIDVKIKSRRTTVTLKDGTKGSVYCYEEDTLDERKGIEFAYYKAKEKQYKKKFLSEIAKFEEKSEVENHSANKGTNNSTINRRVRSLPF